MRVITGRPPNYEKIVAAFPFASREAVLFCYGDAIYSLRPKGLTEALLQHETVHSIRQGNDPDAWWDRYIIDPRFRFDEELEAHIVEYRVASRGLPRQQRRRILAQIAERLSGPLYGRVATKEYAKRLIMDLTKEPEAIAA